MKRIIVLLSAVVFLVCMCACQKIPPSNTDKLTEAPTIPTQLQPTEQKPTETQPTELVDPMVAEIQALLEFKGMESFYNSALLSEYATPADVNLFYLFYDGFRDEPQQPTDEELVLLEGKMGQYWKEMDLFRLPVEKMDAVLMELFGLTLGQTNGVGLDSFTYLEETNCYYTAHTGPYCAEGLKVDNVETQDDGGFLVRYSYYSGDYILRLMPTDDGGYRIASNDWLS